MSLCTNLWSGFELAAALSFAWEPPEKEDRFLADEERAVMPRLPPGATQLTTLMTLLPRKPVTDTSLAHLKANSATGLTTSSDREDRTAPPIVDTASMTFCERLVHRITRPFTRSFWTTDDEQVVLVDWSLLSWSYLEAGLLETAGCLTAYFVALWLSAGITPKDAVFGAGEPSKYFVTTPGSQPLSLASGASIVRSYQLAVLTLVDAPATNASTRSGTVVILLQHHDHPNLLSLYLQVPTSDSDWTLTVEVITIVLFLQLTPFRNKVTFLSIIAGAAIACILVYIPPLQPVFGSYNVDLRIWLVALGFGVFLLMYASIRNIVMRRVFKAKRGKAAMLQLDLHPTVMQPSNARPKR